SARPCPSRARTTIARFGSTSAGCAAAPSRRPPICGWSEPTSRTTDETATSTADRLSGAPKHPPQERRLARLRLSPLLEQRQPPSLARGLDALRVGVSPAAGIALRRDQHVARHGVQEVAAQRAAVGRRLHVLRRADRPPAGLVQFR